jgi:phospholipid/cholesterol/gamma-HCH transport system permease protein
MALADSAHRVGTGTILLGRILATVGRSPGQGTAIVRQLYLVGARSLPVIFIAGAFTGMVVAVQFHETLVRFGSTGLLGTAVGLSLVRELGPVLAALIVIGRAGSACAAEMAIMRADQQLDAIECMAIDAHGFLLAPRLLAFVCALPLLTAIFEVLGIFGGLLVGVGSFGESAAPYLSNMADGVTGRDVWTGCIKSATFGLLIGWVCLAKGFLSEGRHGAEGVSRVTTDAVVIASLGVLGTDYLLSALLL